MKMASNSSTSRVDFASLAGLILAFGGIVGGLTMEGGSITDIAQVTAALIVLGGTVGAVLVTTPSDVFWRACKKLSDVFINRTSSCDRLIAEIIEYSHHARRNGIVSLENDLDNIQDPFLRKALRMGVDGTDLQEIRKVMELEMETSEQAGRAEAKVYEAAGGYAPTVGIIGAVLGLIQVMKHLEDIQMVGHGIAVAFVATVYGVAVANIFFLPAAGKLKARVEAASRLQELMLEGACSIVQGLHPTVIEQKLGSYSSGKSPETASKSSRRPGRARAA